MHVCVSKVFRCVYLLNNSQLGVYRRLCGLWAPITQGKYCHTHTHTLLSASPGLTVYLDTVDGGNGMYRDQSGRTCTHTQTHTRLYCLWGPFSVFTCSVSSCFSICMRPCFFNNGGVTTTAPVRHKPRKFHNFTITHFAISDLHSVQVQWHIDVAARHGFKAQFRRRARGSAAAVMFKWSSEKDAWGPDVLSMTRYHPLTITHTNTHTQGKQKKNNNKNPHTKHYLWQANSSQTNFLENPTPH